MSEFYHNVTSASNRDSQSTLQHDSVAQGQHQVGNSTQQDTFQHRELSHDKIDSENSSKHEEGQNDKPNEKDNQSTNDVDEEKNEAPPRPVGFWDTSLKKARKEVFTGWAKTILLLSAFILCILSLYWAVLFKVEENLGSINVFVVIFDGQVAPYIGTEPLIGRAVEQAARQQSQKPQGVLGYQIKNPSEFNNDPIAVRQAVYDEHAWAAIIVNANATFLLQQAVAQGNTTYDPLGAMQQIYIQARDEATYGNYIIPQLNQLTTNIQAQFGQQWITQVLSNTSLDAATYARAPQALSPAIGTSVFNLRPFGPTQVTPGVSIGLIYLIIIAFFSFSFFLPIHMIFLKPQGHPPLHFWQMCIWRLFATTIAYFFLSLAYSLVSLAFQIPFSNDFVHNDVSVANNPNGYGKGSFVVYWMLNWVGMYALGLASENVTMIIGQPWTALWLIFWVITNVSTAFYTLPLAPGFFRWGYAWPLHNIVEASRTIIFDTHSRIGLNFGVLFVWCALNTIVFFPAAVFMRWMSNKEEAKKSPRRTIKYLVDG